MSSVRSAPVSRLPLSSSSCVLGPLTCLFGGSTKRRPRQTATGGPLRVVLAGVSGHVGSALLPLIARGDLFGPEQKVTIRVLAAKAERTILEALFDELQDGAYPLLHDTSKARSITYHAFEAFEGGGADYVLLLGAASRGSSEERLRKNVQMFQIFGKAINEYAGSRCRVLIAAKPQNTNAFICSHYARDLSKEQFSCLSRLDYNRVLGITARQFADVPEVEVDRLHGIAVWGCQSSQYADTHYADRGHLLIDTDRLQGLPAGIKEDHEEFFQEELQELVRDRVQLLGESAREPRETQVVSKGIAAAKAVADHVRDWHSGSDSRVVPMGVWSELCPWYQDLLLDPNIFFSVPVVCEADGSVRVEGISDTFPNTEMTERIREMADVLVDERNRARQVIEHMERAAMGKPQGIIKATDSSPTKKVQLASTAVSLYPEVERVAFSI